MVDKDISFADPIARLAASRTSYFRRFVTTLIYSYVYRQLLCGRRLQRRFWDLIRRALSKLDPDATCIMTVHGRRLAMPLSHALPIYYKELPFYDRLPARLATFIRGKLGVVRCIDVGANVGDSIAAFRAALIPENADKDFFLAIEPNPHFRKYLYANWGHDPNVEILPYICSASDGPTFAHIEETSGTAQITLLDTGEGIERQALTKRSLNSIAKDFASTRAFNLLKIDTDGHDFEVLRGALDFLRSSRPFLLFEVDSFSNPRFAEDCLDILHSLRQAGYESLFVYDNMGYFMGLLPLSDQSRIKDLLFYKMTSRFRYFDFLLMHESVVPEFRGLELLTLARSAPSAPMDVALFL